MKITGLKFALPGIALACGIAIFSCARYLQNGSDSGTVKIEETGILLTGAPISAPDAKTLEKILKQHDRSLYKIDVYNDGKLIKTLGLLDQSSLNQVTVAKVAERAKRPDFSGWALQICTTTGSTTHPTPTPHNERPAAETAATTTGSTTHPTPTPHNERPAGEMAATTTGSTTHPTPTPHREMSEEEKELLRQVKPILEKYTHK